MAILRAQNLAKSFGERTLFSNVSFEVFARDRVGLIGVNGTGKTTLLRMLTGDEPHDGNGSFSIAKGVRTASLDQSPVWKEGASLYEAALEASARWMDVERELERISNALTQNNADAAQLCRRQAELQEAYEQGGGLTYRSRTRSTLLGLGFTEAELEQEVQTMSGGQMRKAALAKILLSDAELLLLDEPTNHLDVASLEWLENYLSAFRGTILVVSHDRYFLDHVCTRIFEMENGGIVCFDGNYTAYVEHKMDEREFAMRRYRNGLREIKRIEGIIVQQRRWNQARNYVTIASKEKQIERLKSALIKPEDAPQSIRFGLHAEPLTANEVVVCKNLTKRFAEKTLFSHLDLLIQKDERVCLLGANGCGKTTLLNILMSKQEPDEGGYKLGPNVHVGYYVQNTTRATDERTILQFLNDSFPRYDLQVFRNLLGAFLFRGDDVNKRICSLSGGEYARIQLLKLMLGGSNVLFLDEPTNHLDIPSCEALESALTEYGGTMLIITHDRYLANRIADRLVIMDADGLHSFDGDWDGYKAFLAERDEAEKPAAEPKKNAYVLSRERRSAINRAKGALDRAEQAVSEDEARLSELERLLSQPEAASDYEYARGKYDELERVRAHLDETYAAWEAAEREYAALTAEDEAR